MKRFRSRRIKRYRGFRRYADLALISLPKNHGKLFNELCDKYGKWSITLDTNEEFPPELLELGDRIDKIMYSRVPALTQFIRDLMSKKYKASYKRISRHECLVSIQDESGKFYKFTDENLCYELIKTEGPTVTDISQYL